MKNSEIFLQKFNEIESYMRNELKERKEVGFTALVSKCRNKNRIIKEYEYELKQYADLRNALVHNEKKYVLAEPHDKVVEEINKIIEKLLNPIKAIPMFQNEVLTFQIEDSVEEIIKIMYENSFSQIPIYNKENKFEFLLTTNTITRWIGSKAKDEIFDFNENKILELKEFEENSKNYLFINRNFKLYDVIEKFESIKQEKIEALLITHSGKKDEKLIGIITYFDLSKILKNIKKK